MASKKKIVAPSGLKIERKGNILHFTWKNQRGGYSQTYVQRAVHSGKKKAKWSGNITRGKKGTSYPYTVALSGYYPTSGKNTLRGVSFRVRGHGSGWASKTFTVRAPLQPTWVKFTKSDDETAQNTGTFSWGANTKNVGEYWATDTEWQTVLTASTESSGAKVAGWSKGTSASLTGEKKFAEASADIAAGTHTRWFRIRTRGPRGTSKWIYAYHVYSVPIRADITAAGFDDRRVSAEWKGYASRGYPVDSETVLYGFSSPTADGGPSEEPSEEGYSQAKSGGAAVVDTGQSIPENKAVWVRIKTTYDGRSAYSDTKFAGMGTITAPSDLTVKTDGDTLTVTATNNAEDNKAAVMRAVLMMDGDIQELGEMTSGSLSAEISGLSSSDWAAGAYMLATVDGQTFKSSVTWQDSADVQVPNITATKTDVEGSVLVTWDTSKDVWKKAESATISWSEKPDAWDSTDQPETYDVPSTHSCEWRVSGLTSGSTYYFRVRLNAGEGENLTAGPWSEAVSVAMTSAPSVPSLILSSNFVHTGDSFTASWVYATTDGTSQAYAEIREATLTSGGITHGSILATATDAQSVEIDTAALGWANGETHSIAVRVVSSAGVQSDGWSVPVAVTIADPPEAVISSESLKAVSETITDEETSTSVTSTENVLGAIPMTVTVTGAGNDGTTALSIVRDGAYHMMRPDETTADGYDGETVYTSSHIGEGSFRVDGDSLTGRLDDGARYKIIAAVTDALGQTAESELGFVVRWDHQAIIPSGSADVKGTAVYITPTAPEEAEESDTCDIYRLSADAPELIYRGAAFGSTYVDPYPAFGENGGHRLVFVTADGDYITSENEPAWTDLDAEGGDYLEDKAVVIDFDGQSVRLPFNLSIDHTWKKDFTRTQYLGGAIQGDWNPGVQRDASISAVIIPTDNETAEQLRALAVYTGVCHVRTPEGSSFPADVEVKEKRAYDAPIPSFDIDIQAVDPEGFDGMTAKDWEELNGLV